MVCCRDLAEAIRAACPLPLAEEWDNVGLLIGESGKEVRRVMTCLTVSLETAGEAVRENADLIVSHHPFPFRAEKRWTDETHAGSVLLTLVRGGVAVFSPHTAHDSAFWGVNRQLADLFGLTDVKPLCPGDICAGSAMLGGVPSEKAVLLNGELDLPLGSGRIGSFPKPVRLSAFADEVCRKLRRPGLTFVGDPNRELSRLAIGCGAADEFITEAARAGADALLLGEARFHNALLSRELGLALLLPGHYATERFAMERMADRLASLFPDLTVWASRSERDPIRYWPNPRHEGPDQDREECF